ncbi:MAG: sodium/solute symporter [Verrucomicrobiota bacterium]|nr:sodium/solute symporter [Verrucomicrobiota bacterium]
MKSFLPLFVLSAALTGPFLLAKEMGEGPLSWDHLPPLPDEEGFAGTFAGIVSSKEAGKDYLVVAGGANFPEGRPWEKEKNPQKVYYDVAFKLELGSDEQGSWEKLEAPLGQRVAYGMSVTLSRRGSALFIGGKESAATDAVWEVSADQAGELTFSPRVKYPLPIVEGVAGLVGEKVIVVGGATNKEGGGFGTVQEAYMLDTSRKEGEWKWEPLPWPQSGEGEMARGRAYAVAGVRGDQLYMFGGRDYADSAEPAPGRVHQAKLDILADCYALSLKEEVPVWKRLADLPKGMSAAPSAALPVGVSHLLMLGGVSADYWRQQFEDRPELNGAGEEHPGFERTIWAYDTITDTWDAATDLPEAVGDLPVSVPVTTPVVKWKQSFIVPTGEIKPGVRSPQVLIARVQKLKSELGVVNWIVVGVYLAGMVGIGYWFMRRKAAATTEAYFRGGQKIPFLVAGLSIFATVLSSITFMSIPARAYGTDITWYIGQLAMLVLIPVVVLFYLPFFRKLDLTSAYLYLERRFNLGVRLFGSFSFIFAHIGRIAIVLYLPAVALAAVSNINIYAAIIIIGLLCVVYTVMGGIEAVVWTDAIQAVVLLGGAILCFILVVTRLDGGFGELFSIANNDSKLLQNLTLGWDIRDGTKAGLVIFLAFGFNSLVQYTSGQDVVQRYVTTKDIGGARKALWTTMWMSVCFSIVFFLLGTALYAFYKTQPALLDPAMERNDGILPFFIMQQLPVGVAGLIIAAVFAASQSSISSSLNSIATAWTKDVDSRLLRPASSDEDYLRSAKWVVIIVGLLGIGGAALVAAAEIKNAFDTFMGIIGLATGSLGGIFALGVFTKRGNGKGAMAGAVVGIATVAIIKFGGFPVAGILNAFIGFTSCLVVGYLVSLATGGGTEQGEELSIHGESVEG